MKKGAIFGIIAAFIIIAMLIFLPVIINNSKAPAETVSTDVTESKGESTAATATEKTETEPDAVTDGTTAEDILEGVRQLETLLEGRWPIRFVGVEESLLPLSERLPYPVFPIRRYLTYPW